MVELIANHVILAKLLKFFVPKEKTTTMAVIADSKSSKGELRPVNTPRIVLQRGLEIHRGLDLQVDITSPVILFPCEYEIPFPSSLGLDWLILSCSFLLLLVAAVVVTAPASRMG